MQKINVKSTEIWKHVFKRPCCIAYISRDFQWLIELKLYAKA